ncbi:MAG: hypothetical protein WAT26_16300 [Saprospiraceae bacterium]|nr:hypothetical protein [Saprospiraceae bacterium]MBK8885815.1 hypothetical protein [Saprospiraceae bacterium]MBP6539552.1 hypothetical protein [Saprospiraceae bacterium]HQV66507.1 hypothetical protein [Saprospiraceae bacterium]
MESHNFLQILKDEFAFLESDFCFILSKEKIEKWGFELLYKNPSTGVKIIYETHHAYITIFLYRLINDEIIENPRIIDKNVELNCFALDDVLLLRNKASILKPAYEYGENSKYYDKENGFKTYVSEFAKNLASFSGDILDGDFFIFQELEKIVRKRYRKYNSPNGPHYSSN